MKSEKSFHIDMRKAQVMIISSISSFVYKNIRQ